MSVPATVPLLDGERAALQGRRGGVIGAAALGAGEVASRLVAFATAALLARRLGPEGFGVLAFAAACTGYFGLAVAGGLNDLAARDVARNPFGASAIYRRVLSVRLPIALVACGFLLAAAWLLPRPPIYRIVLALSGLSLISLALDPLWAVKALGRSMLAAAAMVVNQALVLGGVALFVSTDVDLVRVPILQFLADAAIFIAVALTGLGAASSGAATSSGLELFRESMPLLFGRGMRAIIVSFDVVLLGFVASSEAVGIYAAAYRLHFFVLALVVAVQTAYLPAMARATSADSSELRDVTVDALTVGALIGAPLIAGGILITGPLLGLLFGPPYAAGAPALRWLLVSLGFLFVHGLLHNVYVVTGRTQIEARWFAAAALLNVIANVFLIPRFGIAGAAAATAMAEALIAAAGVFRARLTSARVVFGAWLKPGVAALAMAGVLWAIGDAIAVPSQLGVGAGVYAIAVLTLVGPRTAVAHFHSLRKRTP